MTHTHPDLHDFHLSLPEATYDALRACAEQRHQPATQLARTVIEQWLKQQSAAQLDQDIADYVALCAGTSEDLDEELEAAGLEQWRSTP